MKRHPEGLDHEFERFSDAFHFSVRAHVLASGDFADLILEEAGNMGVTPDRLGEAIVLRSLLGAHWSADWAAALWPDAEITEEWMAALERARDAHLEWVGV